MRSFGAGLAMAITLSCPALAQTGPCAPVVAAATARPSGVAVDTHALATLRHRLPDAPHGQSQDDGNAVSEAVPDLAPDRLRAVSGLQEPALSAEAGTGPSFRLRSVSNPFPAEGGADAEDAGDADHAAPATLRGHARPSSVNDANPCPVTPRPAPQED